MGTSILVLATCAPQVQMVVGQFRENNDRGDLVRYNRKVYMVPTHKALI